MLNGGSIAYFDKRISGIRINRPHNLTDTAISIRKFAFEDCIKGEGGPTYNWAHNGATTAQAFPEVGAPTNPALTLFSEAIEDPPLEPTDLHLLLLQPILEHDNLLGLLIQFKLITVNEHLQR